MPLPLRAAILMASIFSPASLFANGVAGVWFDPSDLNTMFQDAAGATPVTVVEQPVGLILDKSRGPVTELVTNGTFNVDATGWTASTANVSAAVVGGQLQVTNNGAGWIYQQVAVTPNVPHTLVYQFVTKNGGGRIWVGTSIAGLNLAAVSVAGSGIVTFTPTTSTIFISLGDSAAGTGVVNTYDNLSLRVGTHAVQYTTTARPVLSARVNLFTQTEDFSAAAWTKLGTTVTTNSATAPDGLATADTITEDASFNQHYVSYAISPGVGAISYTIHAKIASGTRFLQMRPIGIGTGKAFANFNLSTGTVDSSGGTELLSTSITAVANGFYRCRMIANHAVTPTGVQFALSNVSTENPSYTGDGAAGLHLWGADLRYTSESALLPPYQRVLTGATADYDDGPQWPRYLKFDGVDDGLVTGVTNLNSSDKATLHLGVRKMSDAATGTICELSSDYNNNAGSFFVIHDTNSRFGQVAHNAASAALNGYAGYYSSAVVGPWTATLAMTYDFSGTTVDTENPTFTVNGASDKAAALGTYVDNNVNFGNLPLYIGRRGGTTLPFNGRLYGLIMRGGLSSPSQFTRTEAWINAKTGAY